MNKRTRSYPLRVLVQLGLMLILGLNVLLVLGALMLLNELRIQAQWTTHTLEVQRSLKDLEAEALRLEGNSRTYWFTGKEEYLTILQQSNRVMEKLDRIQEMVADNPTQLEKTNSLQRMLREKMEFLDATVRLKRAGNEAELVNQVESRDLIAKSQELKGQIDDMVRSEQALFTNRSKSALASQDMLNWTLIGGLALSLGTGAWVTTFLTRRLAPLAACAAMAEQIGNGDLTAKGIPITYRDEVGQVAESLNRMLTKLRSFTKTALESSEKLGDFTARIAAASSEQAVAVQQQFSAVQQTSVTMQELTQSASQMAERAKEATGRMELTSEAYQVGQQAVQQGISSTKLIIDQVQAVADKISSLSEKTQAIRDVVASVNDIAERSNVLALNASILAAAAGTEGKSFTVVANEMKNLADQSKEATKVVRSLLSDIEKGIQASVFLSEEASKRGQSGRVYSEEAERAIRQLAQHVETSVQSFQQIGAANNQQRLAFEQISEALASIRQASEQSASTTRSLDSSSQELRRLSSNLLSAMAQYKLDDATVQAGGE